MPGRAATLLLLTSLAALALVALASVLHVEPLPPLAAPARSEGAPASLDALAPPSPMGARRTLAEATPQRESLTIIGPSALLDLLARALEPGSATLTWQPADEATALAQARATPEAVAISTSTTPLAGLVQRPLLFRALAIIGPEPPPPELTWARLRHLARRTRGGLVTNLPSELMLVCAARQHLTLAKTCDEPTLLGSLARGQLGLVDLATARRLGRVPYAIDGVAPDATAMPAGRYPLGLSLRIVHRFDAAPRTRQFADRLLDAQTTARLAELWPL